MDSVFDQLAVSKTDTYWPTTCLEFIEWDWVPWLHPPVPPPAVWLLLRI